MEAEKRNPERIEKILSKLREKWKTKDQQRFGQFLLNYVFGKKAEHTAYIFYMEDDEILKELDTLNYKGNIL